MIAIALATAKATLGRMLPHSQPMAVRAPLITAHYALSDVPRSMRGRAGLATQEAIGLLQGGPSSLSSYPVRTILGAGNGAPYLRRYTVHAGSSCNVYLHEILSTDPAAPHDHPWPFVSVILAGGYLEHVGKNGELGAIDHKPGAVIVRPAEHIHRLEVDGPAWSLVFTGEPVRTWGFWGPRGWIDWRTYGGERMMER
jgi:hypothetical protein